MPTGFTCISRKVKDNSTFLLIRSINHAVSPRFSKPSIRNAQPSRYTGASAHQVERYLSEVVRPLLAANSDTADVTAEINV